MRSGETTIKQFLVFINSNNPLKHYIVENFGVYFMFKRMVISTLRIINIFVLSIFPKRNITHKCRDRSSHISSKIASS